MNIDVITALLAKLEAGVITWEQALTQVTALPTAWNTTEWKRQRDALIGNGVLVTTGRKIALRVSLAH